MFKQILSFLSAHKIEHCNRHLLFCVVTIVTIVTNIINQSSTSGSNDKIKSDLNPGNLRNIDIKFLVSFTKVKIKLSDNCFIFGILYGHSPHHLQLGNISKKHILPFLFQYSFCNFDHCILHQVLTSGKLQW